MFLRLVKESHLHIFHPAEWDQLQKRPKSRRSFLPWPTLIHLPMLTTSTSLQEHQATSHFLHLTIFSVSISLWSPIFPWLLSILKRRKNLKPCRSILSKFFLFSLVQKLMLFSCYATVLHSFKKIFIYLFNTKNIWIGI